MTKLPHSLRLKDMHKGRKILIVEDEAADAILLKRAFSKLSPDLQIDVAEDGGDALDVLIARNQTEVSDISFPTFELLPGIRTVT